MATKPQPPGLAGLATILPDWLALHTECTPIRFRVAWTIWYLSRDRGYCTETRTQMMAVARVGAHSVIDAIAWLKSSGMIKVEEDYDARSARRIYPLPSPVTEEGGAS